MNKSSQQFDLEWEGFFDSPMAEKFERFHAENPHILRTIVSIVMALKQMGHRHGGMKMIYEKMRCDHMLKTSTDEPFKLNNNYTAFYTRLVERTCPDLVGFFVKRRSQSDEY